MKKHPVSQEVGVLDIPYKIVAHKTYGSIGLLPL
jgi:hypothetical protein